MTTIFPSDDRISEIVNRRMAELYKDQQENNSDESLLIAEKRKQASILDENITNIYERIILDICQECIAELPLHPPLTIPGVLPVTKSTEYTQIEKFKHPLAFYNPPNRLECVQQYVLKRVKKLIGNGIYGQNNNSSTLLPTQIITVVSCNKRKRDHVDEILVQEMMEDESKWTNFDAEKSEVLNNVTNEIMLQLIEETLIECRLQFVRKIKCT